MLSKWISLCARSFILLIYAHLCFGQNFNANFSQGTLSHKIQLQSSSQLSFLQNAGQFGDKTLFKTESGGASFFFCKDEVAYLFSRNTDQLEENNPDPVNFLSHRMGFDKPKYKRECLLIKAQFVGSNPDVQINGDNEVSHNHNYFFGKDRSDCYLRVPAYSSVVYKGLYPGIDLRYHGDGQSLKYDFIISPGADISQIAIRYDGVDRLNISSAGELEMTTSFGSVNEKAPFAYQEIIGKRENIACHFVFKDANTFGFEADSFDYSIPLVIDPSIIYSTYLGGSDLDYPRDICIDPQRNIYIAGVTQSDDFPLANPYQGQRSPAPSCFISKISSGGDSLIYSTYFGGINGNGYILAITSDSFGNSWFAGSTNALDFPTTPDALDTTYGGDIDDFVTKLSSSGDSLLYSTYLGGNGGDDVGDIALGPDGKCYVAGASGSSDFPILHPFDPSYHEGGGFITCFSPSGDTLVFSTIFRGAGIKGIAVDSGGYIYITGSTGDSHFPVYHAYDSTLDGWTDAFITKFTPLAESLVFSTYLGGSCQLWLWEGAMRIALDPQGNSYICGKTPSFDFPLYNAYDSTLGGEFDSDAFAAKFSPSGELLYSTFLGGSGLDWAYDVTIGSDGCAWIVGSTDSPDFPVPNGFDQQLEGVTSAFIAKLSPSGDNLLFGTYLGGSQSFYRVEQYASGVACNGVDKLYVTGITDADDFPLLNPFQDHNAGWDDAFVTVLDITTTPCQYIPGDINGNGSVNGVDIVYAVNFFKGSSNVPPVDCGTPIGPCAESSPFFAAGDVNGNCSFNGIDITFFVRYLKGQVPSLRYCPDCPPAQ